MTLEEIYDGFADTYDANRDLFDMSGVFDAFYSQLLIKPGKLLDLGCGAGEPFDQWFVERGWQVTGVDLSSRMLALAERYVPKMKRMHSDMCRVAFDPERFDAVIAVYSMFHVPSRDHEQLLQKIYRWLAPQGKLLFTYATEAYTGSRAFDGYIAFMGRELYYSHLSPEALYTVLEKTGFVIEAKDERDIGGETFLWVTVRKPDHDTAQE